MPRLWTELSPRQMHINADEYWEVLSQIEKCGILLAYHLADSKILLMDMDGVVIRPTNYSRTQITSPIIIEGMQKLESIGVRIGPATARGPNIVTYLRNTHGLKLAGPGILEDGQVLLDEEGKIHPLVSLEHQYFIQTVKQLMKLSPFFRENWKDVKEAAQGGEIAFCPGNYQWQGFFGRLSYWFHWGEENMRITLLTAMRDKLRCAAELSNLCLNRDIKTSVGIMKKDQLAYLSIKSFGFTKATAVAQLPHHSWVFIGDGPGDLALATITKERKGLVIGVQNNADIDDEISKFQQLADFNLRSPDEVAKALLFAAQLLGA